MRDNGDHIKREHSIVRTTCQLLLISFGIFGGRRKHWKLKFEMVFQMIEHNSFLFPLEFEQWNVDGLVSDIALRVCYSRTKYRDIRSYLNINRWRKSDKRAIYHRLTNKWMKWKEEWNKWKSNGGWLYSHESNEHSTIEMKQQKYRMTIIIMIITKQQLACVPLSVKIRIDTLVDCLFIFIFASSSPFFIADVFIYIPIYIVVNR